MDRIVGLCKQYRYVVLVLLIGVGLMLIPSGEDAEAVTQPQPEDAAVPSMEERLASILSQIDGVGRTSVLLTIAAGAETLYEQDEDSTTGADSATHRVETILVTGSDREEKGLIRQINPPIYQGAIIICQGGDSPAIRLAVVDAVSKATGLTADKITVLKMK